MAPGVGDSQLAHDPEQDLHVEHQGQGVLVDHHQVGPLQHIQGGRAPPSTRRPAGSGRTGRPGPGP